MSLDRAGSAAYLHSTSDISVDLIPKAMATDHIRYDLLAQAALRGVVRTVLADAAKKGLPGDHHFKITFDTTAPGVRLSERMRARYPQEMTIVLQHQFWDSRSPSSASKSACRSAAFRKRSAFHSRR